MDLSQDHSMILTLDAGGTTFTFSALRGGIEQIEPFTLPSKVHDLEECLGTIRQGFKRAKHEAGGADAISFAFPGPSDYPNGIIGDLVNLPCFRGGVPLGPMLEAEFKLPVFINNDGDLFAYGEAIAGLLPEVNSYLKANGSPKRYRNLLGITFGTGFGGGFVHDGRLFIGDNSSGMEIWALRNKLFPRESAEETLSARGIRRLYAIAACVEIEKTPEPKEIYEIAKGRLSGNQNAALEAFKRFGEVAGDALANAITLLDGLVVIGGGLSLAGDVFLPNLVAEMNNSFSDAKNFPTPRMELKAFGLESELERDKFLAGELHFLKEPCSERVLSYDAQKRVGVGLTRLGTSHAVAIGACAYAVQAMCKLRS